MSLLKRKRFDTIDMSSENAAELKICGVKGSGGLCNGFSLHGRLVGHGEKLAPGVTLRVCVCVCVCVCGCVCVICQSGGLYENQVVVPFETD